MADSESIAKLRELHDNMRGLLLHGDARLYVDGFADKLAKIIADLDKPVDGTHAFDLMAATEARHAEVTATLIPMTVATVLAILIDQEGGGRVNLDISPFHMDKMMKDYEMSFEIEGLVTKVKIEPRDGAAFNRHAG